MRIFSKKSAKGQSPAAPTPRLSKVSGLELNARAAVQGLRAGRHRALWHGSSSEFAEHRTYLPGDDVRRLDWRAYGRSDHLLIRCFHDERTLPLVLLLDTSASMFYGEPANQSKIAYAQLTAAVLALLALDQGDEVRILATGSKTATSVPRFAGAAMMNHALRRLKNLSRQRAVGWTDQWQRLATVLKQRSLIVVLSDFLDEPESVGDGVVALRGRGHELVFLQVLHPSEVSLPPWGPVTVTDPEQPQRRSYCDAQRMAEEYAQCLHHHQSALRRLVASLRAEHQLFRTNRPVPHELGRWLVQRRRMGRSC